MTREEAIQILSTRDSHGVLCGYTSGVTEALDIAIEALSAEYEDYEHATLVDIKEPLKVLVVRCKDCKHSTLGEETILAKCELHKIFTARNDFCSYGERKQP